MEKIDLSVFLSPDTIEDPTGREGEGRRKEGMMPCPLTANLRTHVR
jgi:hypothetical protein